MENGGMVAVCLDCFESLRSQFNEGQRYKIPVEKRQYNWMMIPPPPEETASHLTTPQERLLQVEQGGSGGSSSAATVAAPVASSAPATQVS